MGGLDFRAPKAGGGGGENKPVREVGSRIQLDGTWGFQAQFNAIAACTREDDNSFKENSVKEVTDRGRAEAAARLQRALEEALEQDSSDRTSKRKASAIEDERDRGLTEAVKTAEAEVRRDVRALLSPLKELEKVAGSDASNNAALDIFRQLKRLRMTVDCLKATKIAVELNKPCWRGSQAMPEVRDAASSLVRSWRSMYRAQAGKAEGISEATKQRRFRLLSVDLEASAHGMSPKIQQYCRVIEELCEAIVNDPQLCRDLVQGSIPGNQLVGKMVQRVQGAQEPRSNRR
eukprot:TRINITY_DN29531_c0_g1_i2.p1 TRINITY_DN29531_c0_g1~~TRINITY_DN29531_c0_g1_i2.p1  ORF type:complete len:290 (-),score=58.03 TRINITY_DN29531_c0_g1_i2:209-1078(-)